MVRLFAGTAAGSLPVQIHQLSLENKYNRIKILVPCC